MQSQLQTQQNLGSQLDKYKVNKLVDTIKQNNKQNMENIEQIHKEQLIGKDQNESRSKNQNLTQQIEKDKEKEKELLSESKNNLLKWPHDDLDANNQSIVQIDLWERSKEIIDSADNLSQTDFHKPQIISNTKAQHQQENLITYTLPENENKAIKQTQNISVNQFSGFDIQMSVPKMTYPSKDDVENSILKINKIRDSQVNMTQSEVCIRLSLVHSQYQAQKSDYQLYKQVQQELQKQLKQVQFLTLQQNRRPFTDLILQNKEDQAMQNLVLRINQLQTEYDRLLNIKNETQIQLAEQNLQDCKINDKEFEEKFVQQNQHQRQPQNLHLQFSQQNYQYCIPPPGQLQTQKQNKIKDNLDDQYINVIKVQAVQLQIQQNVKQDQKTNSKAVEQPANLQKQVNYQFSSGQVQNLLAQEESIIEKEHPKIGFHTSQQVFRPRIQISNILPSVFQSSEPIYDNLLPLLHHSQSNLSLVRESSQQLPYSTISNIMSLQHLTVKISFRQKHYPSPHSTEKQLKLYGKRIFRLLAQETNRINPRHHMDYNREVQHQTNQRGVAYYHKNDTSFIIICYYNHTFYFGNYVTQGPMQDIVRQGYGIQFRQNKYLYQGDLFADKKHGHGYIQFIGKTPSIYIGYFLDGFIDGNGKQFKENGQMYFGQYKVGQKDGHGKLIYNLQKNIFYEGQFYDGNKHGKGIQLFQNGDSYSGLYLKDKFQGQGQYKWKNGTIYQGNFIEGYKHGKGLLMFVNGKTFEKYYDHNKQINLQNSDDRKTIKTSRLSSFSQNKSQQKTLIQDKPLHLRTRSRQSLLSNLSKSKQKLAKGAKQKKKITDLLKERQIEEDLKNLDQILKQQNSQTQKKRIFSTKRLDTMDRIHGKMYNTIERKPALRISDQQIDLFKLSKMGKPKSLINFSQDQKLQDFAESRRYQGMHPSSNFSEF